MLACYDRGSRFEPSNQQGFFSFSFFISYFITCKQPCELKFMGFMIKSCLIKYIAPNNCKCFIHALYTDLFVNAKPKHSQHVFWLLVTWLMIFEKVAFLLLANCENREKNLFYWLLTWVFTKYKQSLNYELIVSNLTIIIYWPYCICEI